MNDLTTTALQQHPATAFRTYLTDVKLRSPRTTDRYVATLERFAASLPADQDIFGVDTLTVVGFLGSGRTSGRSAGRVSWNLKLSALKAFFGMAAEHGLVARNPTASVERHRTQAAEPEPLSLPEMVKLVAAVEQHSSSVHRARNLALVQTFLHTGLRVAEVVGLTLDQVDLGERLLRQVRRKGNKQFAAVLNDVAAEALADYLEVRHRLRPKVGEGALFISHRGTRLSSRTVQEFLASYGRLAGIGRQVTPHLLRHSTLTQLSALGTAVRTIMDISGHQSLATTQRYLHVGWAERRAAIASLGTAFREAQDRPAA